MDHVGRAQPGAGQAEIEADPAWAARQEPAGADIGKEADRRLRHREDRAVADHAMAPSSETPTPPPITMPSMSAT